MNRPLLMRLLPDGFKTRLFYRYYLSRQAGHPELFREAPLRFAPGAALHDLLPGDVISGHIAFTGFYELALSRQLLKCAQRGGLLIDVGANIGYFATLWAAANESSRAICFEAAPRNLEFLDKNLRENYLDHRVTVIPKAAGNARGEITFDVGPASQTGWGGISNEVTASTITVPMVRLDEELGTEVIDVLKVDVEGADTWVLQGCEKLLQERRIRQIFFEQNAPRMEQLGVAPGLAQAFLRDHGYVCTPIPGAHDEWSAHPTSKH